MKKQTIILNLLAILPLCIVAPVQAENQALMELLKALQENGTIDRQTYEPVKNVAQSESENEKKIGQEIAREEVNHSMDKAANKVVKEKSENSIKIGGRIQVDATAYKGGFTSHNDGTEIRRARLFAKGNLGKAWGYKFQYDFTGDGIDGIQDAYLDF
ncbi:MAG: porin, partial [Gammaproteobacteria bacterium]